MPRFARAYALLNQSLRPEFSFHFGNKFATFQSNAVSSAFGKKMTTEAKQDWNNIRQYYLSFGEGPWLNRRRPMLDIITWIETEGLADTLYAKVGLSGLWISDQPAVPFRDGNMLQISEAALDTFLFEYHRVPGSTDGMKKIVEAGDSVECLRQFLAYKFGIHRPHKKNSEQDAPSNH